MRVDCLATLVRGRCARRAPHYLPVAALIGCLTGCAAEVPIGKPPLEAAAVESQAHALSVHASDRAEVHAALGEPWLASEQFGVEVYRLKKTQHTMVFIIGVPLPNFSIKFEAYTLVVYDAAGGVTGVDAALGKGELEPGDVALRTKDAAFDRSRDVRLSIPFRRFLAARPRDSRASCTVVVVAAGEGGIWDKVKIDNGRELPAPLSYGIVPLALTPGSHTLRFTMRLTEGGAQGRVECRPGDLIYAVSAGQTLEHYSMWAQLLHGLALSKRSGTLDFSHETPRDLSTENVVIYADGEWLAGK